MSWQTAKLGDVCEVVSGATPKTGNPEYWDGDVLWVTPKDLSGLETKMLRETPRKLTAAGLSSCSAKMLPAQSVLFSSRAPIGLVAINEIPVCTNQGFKSLVPLTDRITADYLYWWLLLNRSDLERLGRGATFKEVSKKIVEAVEIPLPPLAEQKRIASILDAADALRAKRRESVTQIEALSQSIFLDMFGDPVANPRELEVRSIGEVLKVSSGKGLVSKDMAPGGRFPVYGGNGIGGYHDVFMFDEPQIVIGRVGAYCGVVHVTKPKVWVTDNALYVRELLRPGETSYVAQALKSANLNQYAGRAAQPLISGSRIYPVSILWPPLDLQRRFGRAVGEIEKQRNRMIDHAFELDALFASLQTRAFEGEI